jgi:hypothetical protein
MPVKTGIQQWEARGNLDTGVRRYDGISSQQQLKYSASNRELFSY